MPHARQQIRTAIVAEVTGLSTTGSNVSSNRVYPHSTMPSLNVVAGSSAVSDLPESLGGVQHRTLMIRIEARAKANKNLENTLDTIALEVEQALADDYNLSGLVELIELDSIDVEVDDGMELPVGLLVLNYRVSYRVAASDPGTIL